LLVILKKYINDARSQERQIVHYYWQCRMVVGEIAGYIAAIFFSFFLFFFF